VTIQLDTTGNLAGAIFTENISASVWSPADIHGAGVPGQPTIVAFNQLYNTQCGGTRANP